MKHKRLFDLPRLKIGPLKSDGRTTKEIPIGFDSPPVTPKSVRPPLSPRTDYALRTACALVLQEYIPPKHVEQDQFDDVQDVESDFDYDTHESAVDKAMEDVLHELNKSTTHIERSDHEYSVSELPMPHAFSPRSTMASEQVFDISQWEQMQPHRVGQVDFPERQSSKMAVEPKSILTGKGTHKRSISQPVLPSTHKKLETQDRPRTAARSDSLMSNGSTSQTDGTEGGWTSSTAPTTAAMTPARSSNRASHTLHSGSTNSSEAKVLASDAEWMRQELEKHKKLQQETKAHQELEDQVSASVADATAPKPHSDHAKQAPAPVVPIPARKPVPKATTDRQRSASAPQPAESRPSAELRRSESRKRRTPRSESNHEMELLRSNSRHAKDDLRPLDGAETANGQSKIAMQRPVVPPAPMPSRNVSEAASRSRSLTRQFTDYIRSRSRSNSRKPSVELSCSEGRAMSMDSSRSHASDAATSIDSTTKRRQKWRPFHRRRGSAGSADGSRPGSSNSNAKEDVRGREFGQSANSQKQKPIVNLNRELPPLPSLDQWKAVEPEAPRPKHIAALFDSRRSNKDEKSDIRDLSSVQEPSIGRVASRHHRHVVADAALPVPQVETGSSDDVPTELAQFPIPPSNSSSVAHLPNMSTLNRTRSEKLVTSGQRHIVSYSRNNSVREVRKHGHSASTPIMGNGPVEQYNRTTSEQQLNFSRKLSSDDYHRMHDTRYHDVEETKPVRPVGDKPLPILPKQKTRKKRWWQSNAFQEKESTWKEV